MNDNLICKTCHILYTGPHFCAGGKDAGGVPPYKNTKSPPTHCPHCGVPEGKPCLTFCYEAAAQERLSKDRMAQAKVKSQEEEDIAEAQMQAKGEVKAQTNAWNSSIAISPEYKEVDARIAEAQMNAWGASHTISPKYKEEQREKNKLMKNIAEKLTNPKDALGVLKAPMSTVSSAVLAEVGVAMLEGAAKYGRHNYRAVGVRSSVYYDAALRHLFSWWEGEDIDPDSQLSHVTKAITTLVVLRDAMIQSKLNDDRPPRSAEFYTALNARVAEILSKYADKNPKHYTIGDKID